MDYRIEQLRYQLREDPSSRLFFQLGEILRRDGQLDEAVGVLRRGLDVHPRYVAAWMALGRALRDRGDALGAERAFSRALELDPENQVAARLIGESAIDRAEWTRAVKALKLARALGTRDDDDHVSRPDRLKIAEQTMDAGDAHIIRSFHARA